MDLQEIGWEFMDWTNLAQDREKQWPDTSMVINTRVE